MLSLRMVPYVLFLSVLPALIILSVRITLPSPFGMYLLDSVKLIAISLLIALVLPVRELQRTSIGWKHFQQVNIVYSLVPINILSSSINVIAKSLKPYLALNRKEPEISGRMSRPREIWSSYS
jgi:glucan phosphoethanolaminetransferase (alkaline phosphatase superfamily)